MDYTRFLVDDEVLSCKEKEGYFIERYVIYSIKIPAYDGQTSFNVKDYQDVIVKEHSGKIWTIQLGVPKKFVIPTVSEIRNGDLAYWDDECIIFITDCYEMMKDYEGLLKKAKFSVSSEGLKIY